MKHRIVAVWFMLALIAAAGAPLAHGQFIIAHRGASHDAPENTLASFNLAWEQGADGIENDWYLTKDGKLICSHDPDTQRTAGVKHVIKETTFQELRQLDVGSWKNAKYRGERMPSLEEVIATVPKGKKIFIELKIGPEIVAPVAKVLKASSLEKDQIVIISFKGDSIAEFERQMPELKTQLLVRYEQDKQTKAWKPTLDEVEAALAKSRADALGTQAQEKVVDKPFLDSLRAAGHREFGVWTVDDAKVARFYQRLGAWSITTNRPGWLREQLQSAPGRSAKPQAAKRKAAAAASR
jgi:glycerophosphoryl diester phosphodiesterase